jgi:hypothetical protein
VSIHIIEARLQQYTIQSKQDELNALKEIIQEIALSILAQSDFFRKAAFQGGTCLRIIYGLPRFSEDLDFILQKTNPDFVWQPYLDTMQHEFEAYGLNLEAHDRSKSSNTVKKAFIKEDSFGKVLNLHYPRNLSDKQKVEIKFEVDTRPPTGSGLERKFIDFPIPSSITLQDMPSLFSGKCHALLCRDHIKGRDWFDFIWYVARKSKINYTFLKNALYQTGPWEGQELNIDKDWLIEQLITKINNIDWHKAKLDVEKFLRPKEAQSLNIWGAPLFLNTVDKLSQYHD